MPSIKSKVDDEPAASFTSMIDVVFLLLIFFILQPFKSPEMLLRNELPKDVGPASNPDVRNNIRLVVRRHPTDESLAMFYINTRPLGMNAKRLAGALLEAANDDREVPVAIAADPKVHFRHVLQALDQCHEAEMQKVSFEAPPPQTARNTG